MMSVLPALQPPPTAEELALKEQVTQVLTSQGVLAKLKAELRAAVFEVMHEREGFVKKNVSMAPKLSDFPLGTRTTALSLIVECLQFFHWEHALRVLLAETNAEDEQQDSAMLAKKLGLASNSSSNKPTLFQLIESRILGVDQSTVSANPLATTTHDRFDDEDDEESQADDAPAPKESIWEREEIARPLLLKEPESTEKATEDEAKDEQGESSADIEESMAEEVPSGSELEESNLTNYEEEEQSRDGSAKSSKQATALYSTRLQEESQGDDDKAQEDSHGKDDHESDDDDAVPLAEPPPAPAKLPALPPLVGAPNGTSAGNTEDDFDAEEEAERLRKLDAALQAMEAEDDTGTLQQLKASLQMELQEQDSFVSSGGLGKAEEDDDDEEVDAGASKPGKNDEEDEDGYGYGSSDFEEEEEIASEISEEMESMPEFSDESAAVPTTEVEPPHMLRNDTRVENEDALNSYDYIEDVEK